MKRIFKPLRPAALLLAALMLLTAAASCTPADDPADRETTAPTENVTVPVTEADTLPATDPVTEPATEPETEPETFEITFPDGDEPDITAGGALCTPVSGVSALMIGKDYAFRDLIMTRASVPAADESGSVYADAAAVCALLGFTVIENTDTLVRAEREQLTVSFALRSNGITVGEDVYAFPTVIRQDGHVMICADRFAAMCGYETVAADGILYIAADRADITEERMKSMTERYQLYEDAVFSTESVECDQTGVGKYDKVDPAERMVGIAYTTWFWKGRQWGKGQTWDLPLLGKYTSYDTDVIYQHGIWLRDAGVDFVFVDWSNNTCYDPATMAASRQDFRTIEEGTDLLFEVWSQIEGAPKICFLMGPGHAGQENVDNGNHQKKVDQVYRDYVEKYPDLFFFYEGKPLIICYGATPTQYGTRPRWTDDRFTVRWMTGYVGQQTNLYNPKSMASQTYWSWEERGTQTYCVKGHEVEAVTCTAASRPQGAEGQSGYIPAYGRENGATLRRQFQRAIDLGARFAIVVSWNEWTTGEQPSLEVSKDIEPSQTYGTFYLDLLTELIKQFKGEK